MSEIPEQLNAWRLSEEHRLTLLRYLDALLSPKAGFWNKHFETGQERLALQSVSVHRLVSVDTKLLSTVDTPSKNNLRPMGPTQPPTQCVPGTLYLGVKPGREDNHSPPSSAVFKNAWSYTSTPQYAFMAWCTV